MLPTGYVKTDEDARTFQFENDKGSRVTIPKHILRFSDRAAMSRLPLHKKDGGLINPQEDEDERLAAALDPTRNQAIAAANMAQPVPVVSPGQMAGIAPPAVPNPGNVQPVIPPSLAQVQAQNAAALEAAAPRAMAPAMQSVGGYAQEAQTAGALGNAEANAIQKMQDENAELGRQTQKSLAENAMEHEKLLKDYGDGKIDPDAVMKKKNGWLTAIGLILGGIGGGLTHTPNAAAAALDSEIENDLKVQQANLGVKKSLLDANLAKRGNLEDALKETRVQKQVVLAQDLQKLQARSKSPMAQAKFQQEIDRLRGAAGAGMQDLAVTTTAKRMAADGALSPVNQIKYLVPPENQQKALEELTKVRSSQQLRSKVLETFDAMANETKGLDVGHAKPAHAAWGPVMMQLYRDIGGEASGQQLDTLKALGNVDWSTDSSVAKKRAQLVAYLGAPTTNDKLDLWGINYKSKDSANTGFKPR